MKNSFNTEFKYILYKVYKFKYTLTVEIDRGFVYSFFSFKINKIIGNNYLIVT